MQTTKTIHAPNSTSIDTGFMIAASAVSKTTESPSAPDAKFTIELSKAVTC